jgi:hypothetical protein
MRITIFDGFRGMFLVFMTVNHLNAILHTNIGRLTPGALGFVENAHGFVLMSGLVVGLVYGKRLLRQGDAALDSAIWGRMRMIWTWHAALIVLFAAMALLLPGVGVLSGYVADPIGLPLASLGLVGASEHMGILPMYLWFMLAVPFVLRAFKNGDMTFVLIVSFTLWLFAQSGAGQAIAARADAAALTQGFDSGFGLYFNVFGWQLLFVAGMAAGWKMASGRLDLSWITGRVAFLALIAFGLLFGLDRLVNDGWLGAAGLDALAPLLHRGNFAVIHLVSIAVDTVLVIWLLTRADRGILLKLAIKLRRLLNFPPLVLLGQHSLQVFAAHLPMIYLVHAAKDHGLIEGPVASLIIIVSPLWLYAAARLDAAWSNRTKSAQAAA